MSDLEGTLHRGIPVVSVQAFRMPEDRGGHTVLRTHPTTGHRMVYVVWEAIGGAGVWVQRLHRRAPAPAPYDVHDEPPFGPFPFSIFELAPKHVNSSPIVIYGKEWQGQLVERARPKFAVGDRVRVVGKPDAFTWIVGECGTVRSVADYPSYVVEMAGGGNMGIPEQYLAHASGELKVGDWVILNRDCATKHGTGPLKKGDAFQVHEVFPSTVYLRLGATIEGAVVEGPYNREHVTFLRAGEKSIDYFGDGAIEGFWTEFDPRACKPNANEKPVVDAEWETDLSPEVSPATQRAIRAVARKGRRIAAKMLSYQQAVEREARRLEALETPPVPVRTHFVCECGATVRVGTSHSCNGWRSARPMRSAGPLMGSDGYDDWAKARADEQERIESWDEIYDDHRPRDSQR